MRINKTKYELAKARSGKSTTDMVNEYGLRRATVCRAAQGKECLPKTIGKIARALQCDVVDIIDIDIREA